MQEEPLSQLPVFFLVRPTGPPAFSFSSQEAFWLPFYLQDFYMVQCGLTVLSPRIGRWQALKSLTLAENLLKVRSFVATVRRSITHLTCIAVAAGRNLGAGQS